MNTQTQHHPKSKHHQTKNRPTDNQTERAAQQPQDHDDERYLSHSKSFINIARPYNDQSILDLKNQESKIQRTLKLIEKEYRNQPLEITTIDNKLRTDASNTTTEIRNMKKPLDELANIAAYLSEFGPELQDEIKQTDLAAQQIIENIQILSYKEIILNDLKSEIHHHHHPSLNVHQELCNRLIKQLKRWDSLNPRQKFGNQKPYKEFRSRIWEASGSEVVMPNVKTYLSAEGDEESESSDEELEIAGGAQNYKCPLCLKYFKDPLVSKKCQHTFCEGCFKGYMEQNLGRNEVQCPNAGCETFLNLNSLELDINLGNRVKQFVRRKQQRLEEDDEQFDGLDPSSQDHHKDNGNDLKFDLNSSHKSSRSKSSQKKQRVIVDDSDED